MALSNSHPAPANDAAPVRRRPRHFSMVRDFHLADFFTLGNAACGVAAIFVAMLALASGIAGPDPRLLLIAAAFAPAAFIFDVLDGRIARWRQQHSALGRELDSLADVISFGVAPATLAFAAGMQGGWDAVVLAYFVCCGVSRLARFNVTAEALAGEDAGGKVKYFEGTPIPTSVLLTGLLAIAAWQGRVGDQLWGGSWSLLGWQLHPMVLPFALSGSLMISKTIRIPKF